MSVLWVTSFNDKIAHSGERLIKSFLEHNIVGELFVALEGPITLLYPLDSNIIYRDIVNDSQLKGWLQSNSDIIPEELGGRCKQNLPWFNKHASRWFRKIIALQYAIHHCQSSGWVIWIDADSEFIQQVTQPFIRNLLFNENQADIFYMRGIRPVMEAGLFGLNMSNALAQGNTIFEQISSFYLSGNFRGLKRWDDSFVIQSVLEKNQYKHNDIVKEAKTGPHASVIEYSLVKNHIKHHKGSHGRIQKIFS